MTTIIKICAFDFDMVMTRATYSNLTDDGLDRNRDWKLWILEAMGLCPPRLNDLRAFLLTLKNLSVSCYVVSFQENKQLVLEVVKIIGEEFFDEVITMPASPPTVSANALERIRKFAQVGNIAQIKVILVEELKRRKDCGSSQTLVVSASPDAVDAIRGIGEARRPIALTYLVPTALDDAQKKVGGLYNPDFMNITKILDSRALEDFTELQWWVGSSRGSQHVRSPRPTPPGAPSRHRAISLASFGKEMLQVMMRIHEDDIDEAPRRNSNRYSLTDSARKSSTSSASVPIANTAVRYSHVSDPGHSSFHVFSDVASHARISVASSPTLRNSITSHPSTGSGKTSESNSVNAISLKERHSLPEVEEVISLKSNESPPVIPANVMSPSKPSPEFAPSIDAHVQHIGGDPSVDAQVEHILGGDGDVGLAAAGVAVTSVEVAHSGDAVPVVPDGLPEQISVLAEDVDADSTLFPAPSALEVEKQPSSLHAMDELSIENRERHSNGSTSSSDSEEESPLFRLPNEEGEEDDEHGIHNNLSTHPHFVMMDLPTLRVVACNGLIEILEKEDEAGGWQEMPRNWQILGIVIKRIRNDVPVFKYYFDQTCVFAKEFCRRGAGVVEGPVGIFAEDFNLVQEAVAQESPNEIRRIQILRPLTEDNLWIRWHFPTDDLMGDCPASKLKFSAPDLEREVAFSVSGNHPSLGSLIGPYSSALIALREVLGVPNFEIGGMPPGQTYGCRIPNSSNETQYMLIVLKPESKFDSGHKDTDAQPDRTWPYFVILTLI
eukprot:GEMP01013201.1.p1 GENE.GEMP01013201.1~~GEMP01013201.1.p1  ORF type:complete len:779 (+),score=124.25 GEMP01013201.1:752-3088(+)